MLIRPERPSDLDAITNLVISAFKGNPYSQQNEHRILDALRNNDGLALSLVAEEGRRVIGHLAFSPVTIKGKPAGYYGLGPVAVLPEKQGRGTGTALIREGLRQMALKAKAVVVLGEPEYYERFGFKAQKGLFLKGVPPENFLAYSFEGSLQKGEAEYHRAFYVM